MTNKSFFPLAYVWIIIGSLLSIGCEKENPVFNCVDSVGCVTVEKGDFIKIGVLQALSGKVKPLGREQVRGIELALDQRNHKILMHSVLLQTEDTGCTAEGGANAALKIIADPQTIAILGTTCSGAAATVANAMSRAGLTMISGNNSAPFLTSIGGKAAPNHHPGYFRTVPNEEAAGKAAAIYAYKKLGIRRVATIHDGDIYSHGLTDGFAQAFQKLGGKIVLATSVNKGDKEMLPVLHAVLNSRAQLLFFPLFQPEGNYIVLQARKMRAMNELILMSDGALIENSFIEDVVEAGKGMYFVGPVLPADNPRILALEQEYLSTYNTLPSAIYYLNAYDAANLLFYAIERVAVQEPDGTLHIGRQALRDSLYATKEFPGISSSLACDEFGDCALPIFNVLRLDDPKAGVEGLHANVMFSYPQGK